MKERRKTDYEPAILEVFAIRAEDVISTSDVWNHVDGNSNSWVKPTPGDKWS